MFALWYVRTLVENVEMFVLKRTYWYAWQYWGRLAVATVAEPNIPGGQK